MTPSKALNIVGIKEAGGDADRVSQLRQALGQAFSILSATMYDFAVRVGNAEGVTGVASTLSRQLSRMVNSYATGKTAPRSNCISSITRCSGTFSLRPIQCRLRLP